MLIWKIWGHCVLLLVFLAHHMQTHARAIVFSYAITVSEAARCGLLLQIHLRGRWQEPTQHPIERHVEFGTMCPDLEPKRAAHLDIHVVQHSMQLRGPRQLERHTPAAIVHSGHPVPRILSEALHQGRHTITPSGPLLI